LSRSHAFARSRCVSRPSRFIGSPHPRSPCARRAKAYAASIYDAPLRRHTPYRAASSRCDTAREGRHCSTLASSPMTFLPSSTRTTRPSIGAPNPNSPESTLVHGESLSIDPIGAMRSSASGALLYAWTGRPHPSKGRAHAKLAVADADLAFLTSASLTSHALEKNIEAGVVLMGGHVSLSLHAQLHALIETTNASVPPPQVRLLAC
jgi:hypothetical protein